MKKIATLLIFLLQGVGVETANQCGVRKKTSFAKKWMWSKMKILRMPVTVDSCRQKSDVNGRNISFQTLYGGQFALSTELIIPNYPVKLR